MKKLHKGSKSIPMARMHGDNIQFGFKSDAMLRVLVSVGDKRASIENVQEAMHMKQPALMPEHVPALIISKEPSGNDYEYESVIDHMDESGNTRIASNRSATTENVPLEHRIEKLNESTYQTAELNGEIKETQNLERSSAEYSASNESTPSKMGKIGSKHEMRVLDGQRNVEKVISDISLKVTSLN